MNAWRRELMAVSERIAALCYERNRIVSEEFLKEICPAASAADEEKQRCLADIECQQSVLKRKRRLLLQMGKYVV